MGLRCPIAKPQQRLPTVGPVLLPEGAVGLEAADVLLRRAHDGAAVAKRSRHAALDAVRIRIEADAQQGLALARERAKAVEVAQAFQNGRGDPPAAIES